MCQRELKERNVYSHIFLFKQNRLLAKTCAEKRELFGNTSRAHAVYAMMNMIHTTQLKANSKFI